MTIRERILGGLWAAVCGDTLGVPAEFTPPENCEDNPVTETPENRPYKQPAGAWSADSSLLFCTVEGLCEEYNAERIGRLFYAWREQGHWTPYGTVFNVGATTNSSIERLKRGVRAEDAGGSSVRDNGNGSLLRILPVALRYANGDPLEMVEMAHRISGITHQHIRSQIACGIYCLVVRGLMRGMDPDHAVAHAVQQARQCYGRPPFSTELNPFKRILLSPIGTLPATSIESHGYVVQTLEASLWTLLHAETLDEAFTKATEMGVANTSGCTTGGLIGVWKGIEAIPQVWINALARHEDIEGLFDRFVSMCN